MDNFIFWTCSRSRLSDLSLLITTSSWRRGGKRVEVQNTEFISESEVTQSCLALCDPMDCSLPGFSVHGILQARILEWIAISFSRRSSHPRVGTRVSHIVGRCFTICATREVISPYQFLSPRENHEIVRWCEISSLGLFFPYLNHLFPSIFDNQNLALHGFSGEMLFGSTCTQERISLLTGMVHGEEGLWGECVVSLWADCNNKCLPWNAQIDFPEKMRNGGDMLSLCSFESFNNYGSSNHRLC